jgi:hypothetical protein
LNPKTQAISQVKKSQLGFYTYHSGDDRAVILNLQLTICEAWDEDVVLAIFELEREAGGWRYEFRGRRWEENSGGKAPREVCGCGEGEDLDVFSGGHFVGLVGVNAGKGREEGLCCQLSLYIPRLLLYSMI